MDELNIYKYEAFLTNQITEQAKFERFINECVLMTESKNSIDNISVLNESLADSISNGVKKFLTMIAKMWGKFIEGMDTLIKRDKSYLEKYKDTILKKKMVERTVQMYDYENGLKILTNSAIPAFNYPALKDSLASDASFIAAHFNNYVNPKSTTPNAEIPSFVDQVKSKFRGGREVEMSTSKINMTNVFNYCYGYQNMKSSIEKDINNVKKAGSAAIEIANKMAREGAQNESNILATPKYFSFITESLINEFQVVNGKEGNSNQQQSSPTNPGDKSQPETRPDKANVNINDKDSASNDDEVRDNITNVKEDSDRINRYFKLCGDFLAAKLTVAEEMYKEYMSLIKMHIRDYVGTKDKIADNKSADQGSDYNNKDDVEQIFKNINNPKKK